MSNATSGCARSARTSIIACSRPSPAKPLLRLEKPSVSCTRVFWCLRPKTCLGCSWIVVFTTGHLRARAACNSMPKRTLWHRAARNTNSCKPICVPNIGYWFPKHVGRVRESTLPMPSQRISSSSWTSVSAKVLSILRLRWLAGSSPWVGTG